MAKFLLSLERLPALLALSALDPDQVPDAAALALESGLDSQVLRSLADPSLVRAPVQRAALATELARLGMQVPSIADAASWIARRVATEIVNGTSDPMVAAHQLASLYKNVFGHSTILDPFVYADSEFEDRPAERQLFERMVRAAAADLAKASQ